MISEKHAELEQQERKFLTLKMVGVVISRVREERARVLIVAEAFDTVFICN